MANTNTNTNRRQENRSRAHHARVAIRMADYGSCPYLPDRHWIVREIAGTDLGPADYETAMGYGWRRGGNIFYQPACPGCAQCIPLRLDAQRWHPGARQRKLDRLNSDLELEVEAACFRADRFELYRRYQAARHGEMVGDGAMAMIAYELSYFSGFSRGSTPLVGALMAHTLPRDAGVDGHPRLSQPLQEDREATVGSPRHAIGVGCAPTGSAIVDYRRASDRRLVANGYIDILPKGISSVYFTFDPDHARRSLGTWSVGRELALVREMGARYYYLGFWIPRSPKMNYKAQFPPFEIAVGGEWRAVGDQREALELVAGLPGFSLPDSKDRDSQESPPPR